MAEVEHRDESNPPAPVWLSLAYPVTVFLSAFLLFQVQPLVSRAILPWFGGTPGVWSVCMLFFQLVLFAGYAYSHLVTTRLSPRLRTTLHIVLLVTAWAVLPILPGVEWKPAGDEDPTGRILLTLLASVGLPFFVLATTGPLLQAWFAGTHPTRSPYRLYALSNIGSLLALLSYPFVVEPLLGLADQAAIWTWTFGAFALLCATCGLAAVRYRVPSIGPDRKGGIVERRRFEQLPSLTVGASESTPSLGPMAFWFVLAMVPSVMLLATTNQVCLDVASIPFLWVLPLSLYLISFVLCFDGERWYSRSRYGMSVLLTSGAVIWALAAGPEMSLVAQVTFYFGALFASAMFCHGELAELKPAPEHLTRFYLVMSAGGAAGGLFTALLAPVLFDGYYELPLAIVASAMLVFVVDRRAATDPRGARSWSWPVLGTIVLLLACGLGFTVMRSNENVVHADRSFFGVLRVQDFTVGPKSGDKDPTAAGRRLLHGRITHGKQYRDAGWHDRPTMYYGPMSGVGRALASRTESGQRVGMVGLGTGTLAVYARPGDTYRFYEIDPTVIAVAHSHFDFLDDCAGDVTCVPGDARLVLEREEPRRFDVLALDAFSSDAIPTHLLTHEAMAIYLRHLADDGLLAIHVSNKHFDLEPVLAAHAEEFGLSTRYANVLLDAELERATGCTSSTWVLLARDERALERGDLTDLPRLPSDVQVTWTDDATNVVAILHDTGWTSVVRDLLAVGR